MFLMKNDMMKMHDFADMMVVTKKDFFTSLELAVHGLAAICGNVVVVMSDGTSSLKSCTGL